MKRTLKQRHAALPDGRHNVTGERIRQMRTDQKMTQTQFAERLRQQGVNFDQKSISALEVGRRGISDFELKAMADVLGVGVQDFF